MAVMAVIVAGLANAVALTAWGAHAAVPWRLRRAGGKSRRGSETGDGGGGQVEGGEASRAADLLAARRRRWGWAALPVLVTGLGAGIAYVRARPDAALAAGLLPLTAHLPGRLLGILLLATLLVDLLLLAARDRLEDAGWAIAAGFGLLLAADAALTGELMRQGEGPAGPLSELFGAAACRLLLALAAGELLAPGRLVSQPVAEPALAPLSRAVFRPFLAPLAGLALPVHLLLLPPGLRHPFLAEGAWMTAGAAALLLLAAPWAPPRLRRATLAAGVLLACLALGRAADLSQTLALPAPGPLPALPGR